MKIQLHPRFRASALFALFFLFEIGLAAFLVRQDRIPQGHDGFQYFTLQYYFMNGLLQYGEIPQWMPYMTQGTVATWWYAVQGGLGSLVLYPFAPYLKGVHFNTLFHVGFCIESVFFLLGVWLLARRHFRDLSTVAFVVAGCMGSLSWYDQPWFNFHLVYLLPLLLHFWHGFWDSGKYRYLFVAANLFVLQIIGGLPYFLPLTTLILALYIGTHLFTEFRHSRAAFWARVRFQIPQIPLVVFLGLGLWGAAQLLNFGTDSIVNYNVGRSLDGSVNLRNFLTHGYEPILASLEPWLRLPLRLDYTLYTGFSSLALLLWLTRVPGTRRLLFLFPLVFLILFSIGTLVSVVSYLLWPKMNYYRHITQIYSVIRLFWAFSMGLALERLIEGRIEDQKFFAWTFKGLVGLGVFVFVFFGSPHLIGEYTSDPFGIAGSFQGWLDPAAVRISLGIALAFITAILLWFRARSQGRRAGVAGVGVLVAIQVLDMAAYRSELLLRRTHRMSAPEKQATQLQLFPYSSHRSSDYLANPRFRALSYFYMARPGLRVPYGEVNWTSETFFFHDAPGTSWRVDHWLLPLDDLLRYYWKQPLRDFSVEANRGPGAILAAPLEQPGFRWMAGVDKGKVQFFSGARSVPDAISMTKAWSNSMNPQGLWIEGGDENAESRGIALPYRVTRFEPNHFELEVEVPAGVPTPWLYYADVFHPEWEATTNGEKAKIYKANLAYKAIRLKPGKQSVAFSFYSQKIAWLQMFWSFNALGLFLWIALDAARAAVRSKARVKHRDVLSPDVPTVPSPA